MTSQKRNVHGYDRLGADDASFSSHTRAHQRSPSFPRKVSDEAKSDGRVWTAREPRSTLARFERAHSFKERVCRSLSKPGRLASKEPSRRKWYFRNLERERLAGARVARGALGRARAAYTSGGRDLPDSRLDLNPARDSPLWLRASERLGHVCVCVCVCEREREPQSPSLSLGLSRTL